jgi:sodium/hydrogen antiporter
LTIRLAVMATVFLSIFAHGLSAQPGLRFYAAKLGSLGPDAPENRAPVIRTIDPKLTG